MLHYGNKLLAGGGWIIFLIHGKMIAYKMRGEGGTKTLRNENFSGVKHSVWKGLVKQ